MWISEAESVVMEALWADSPLSADQVADRVARDRGWTLATVKSLLNRLLKKRAVAADRDGRRYAYRPVLAREDYVAEEARAFRERVFGGGVTPLIAHFARQDELSEDELRELQRLVEELGGER